MGSKRKTDRAAKKAAEKEIKKKINLFDKLPDECSACLKEYDKTSKQMAMEWNVVVRKKEGIVRLYCPECWEAARQIAAKYS